MNAKKSDKNEAAGLEDEAGCPSQSWTGVRGYCSCHMDLCSRDSLPALTGNQSEKYTTSLSLLLARHMREKLYFHINKYLKVILFVVCLWFIGGRGAFVFFFKFWLVFKKIKLDKLDLIETQRGRDAFIQISCRPSRDASLLQSTFQSAVLGFFLAGRRIKNLVKWESARCTRIVRGGKSSEAFLCVLAAAEPSLWLL